MVSKAWSEGHEGCGASPPLTLVASLASSCSKLSLSSVNHPCTSPGAVQPGTSVLISVAIRATAPIAAIHVARDMRGRSWSPRPPSLTDSFAHFHYLLDSLRLWPASATTLSSSLHHLLVVLEGWDYCAWLKHSREVHWLGA